MRFIISLPVRCDTLTLHQSAGKPHRLLVGILVGLTTDRYICITPPRAARKQQRPAAA
ncbi:MAG: hypothetical protein V4747_03130 [Pseudomonadota bacterium]